MIMVPFSIAESMLGAPPGRQPLIIMKKVQPRYPNGETNFSGRVEVDFVVKENGDTNTVTVPGDVDPAVRKACEDAVYQWKFQPYHDDGKLRKAKTYFIFHAPEESA
ncbi:hypothetical protein CXB49_16930 [Chromobacterium sp. ATCC 53434]|nr:hypothetical protein CXB49_16930 [Chromobacterium sp. ATCC 53434]